MRKAKIICTMGPASREEPTLSRLVEAGMDVARLNFSHGSHDDHARAISNVRKAAENAGRPVALLLDLQGPKIRVGKIEGGKVKLEPGAETIITAEQGVSGTPQRFSCSYEGLPEDLSIGDPVLINDGAIRLEVIGISGKDVKCRVVVGGMLSDHKGINLPGTAVSIPAMTPKDIEDLKFGLELEVDYVAMSFVRNADDIRLIKRYAPTTPVIAKLEKPQAVDRVDEIAQLAEGVMVARGDLGVEMPLERVPLIQKSTIERTNYYGKIAIVATQMLESMIVSPQPTRAEVSDVANAVLDGADAVMLSAETATGAHPIEAVRTMAAIVEEVERSARFQALPDPTLDRGESTFATAVARACAAAAQQLGIGTICVYTRTGETARQIAEYRPQARILAFTASDIAYRRMALYWGVTARKVKKPFDTTDEMIASVAQTLVGSGEAMRGEAIVIASAVPPNRPTFGASMMQIHRL
ncbi:MAG TPA: pyruvate kinase [Myxococcales bacterium]|jgi:pyruvate kinase|nr:pyruvate kinase [Myxococcales bacterium]